jgi:hypothetical protein
MKRRMKRHAVTQPLDQSYRLIPLTQGQNAIVDTADYDWLNQWNWTATWCPFTKSFYAQRRLPNYGKLISMHRFILGCQPGEEGDHKNNNTLDHRRNNLRKCNSRQNRRNQRVCRGGSSKYKGVCWNKVRRKWRAIIKTGEKQKHIGLFASEEDAARAYDAAAIRYFGEFAHLNFTT